MPTGTPRKFASRWAHFEQTSFHFLSPGAKVELSSQDVDGDNDGDLVVFEPLSSQPIGVWINDGAGSFHEGRLADFRKLWSERPGSAWRGPIQQLPLFAISDERTQSLTPSAALSAPEPIVHRLIWQNERAGGTYADPISARAPSPQLLIPTKVIVS